jgi:MFS family permease
MSISRLFPSRRLPGGRPFALLVTGLAVSSCGDWLYNVALLALVYARTGSPTWVALTTAARVAPMVVLGPFGGVLADRFNRRLLLLAGDMARAAAMIFLATVAAIGLPVMLVPLTAAVATAAGIAHAPCVAACTARFVDETELQRASAMRAAIGQGAVVVGPALGAVVLLVAPPAVAFLLNAVSFLVCVVTTLAIPAGPAFVPAERAATPRLLADLSAGAAALRDAPTAVRLVAADVLCSAVYGLLSVTLLLVSRRIGAGSSGYGLLLGAVGAGGLLGAALTGRLNATLQWRRALLGALGLVALSIAAVGVSSSLAPALGLALLVGGGMVVGEVLGDAALPRMLDDTVFARAYGFVLPACVAGIAAGALVAGPLVSLLGLAGAQAVAGLFVLAMTALLVRRPLDLRPAAGAMAA